MVADDLFETLYKLKLMEPLMVHAKAKSIYQQFGLNFDNYLRRHYDNRD